VLVEKPEFASGTADTLEAAKAAALFKTKSAVIILRTKRVARTSRSSVLAIEFIATAAQCGTNNDLTAPGIRGLSARLWEGSQRKCWTPMIWRYGTRSIG